MGNRLRKIKEANNMSTKQLAERLECDPKTINRYENGQRDMGTDIIEKICAIFNCSSDYLLGLTEEEPRFWYGITKEAYEKGISRDELEAAILKFLDAKDWKDK